MLDKNQPLWLPKGSVRAILALIGWCSTIAMLFLRIEVPDLWQKAVLAIAGFYFLVKFFKDGVEVK